MNAETFFESFDLLADAPNSVAKLRELIIEAGVTGRLGTQSRRDKPAAELVEEIRHEFGSSALSGVEANSSLPSNWTQVALQEIAEYRLGKMLDKGKNKGTLRPYLRNTNVQWFRFDLSDVKEMRFEDGEIDSFEVRFGDLLICEGGEPGRCAVWKDPTNRFMIQKAIHRVRPRNGISSEFLALRLRIDASTGRLDSYFTGATIKHFTGQALARYTFPLPPIEEQRRIVSKVDELLGLCDELETRQGARRELRGRLVQAALDQLLASRDPADFATQWQRLQANFDILFDTPATIPRLRQTILQLAIQGRLVAQDAKDEPANRLIERIEKRKSDLIRQRLIPKQSELPSVPENNLPFDVPMGWQWIRLESVCEIITKGSSPTWQGVQYVDADDGILFVTSENVGNYTLRKMDDPKYVEPKFNEMEPRSILQRGDLLVNLVGGSIGRSAIFDRDDIANINQAVGIIRLVRGEIAIERWYLLHYLNSPASLRIMFAEQVETARANLSLTNMKHFLVPLPPLAEQRRIVSKVDELLGLCDRLEANLTYADTVGTQVLAISVQNLLTASDVPHIFAVEQPTEISSNAIATKPQPIRSSAR